MPPLTVLGNSIFVPAHAFCSFLSFLGPGLPCVCQILSTQEFGLLPLSFGGGVSVQALSLFARAHESGGAAGGCKESAMPPILSWSLAADNTYLGWGTHRTLLLTPSGPA